MNNKKKLNIAQRKTSYESKMSLMWLEAKLNLISWAQQNSDELKGIQGQEKKRLLKELYAVILAFEHSLHVKPLNTQSNETQG